MSASELEGSEVLEALAAIDKVDAFYEAVDSDNFGKAKSLLKKAGVSEEDIDKVLKQMADGE